MDLMDSAINQYIQYCSLILNKIQIVLPFVNKIVTNIKVDKSVNAPKILKYNIKL